MQAAHAVAFHSRGTPGALTLSFPFRIPNRNVATSIPECPEQTSLLPCVASSTSMRRPTLIVAEPEPGQALSTRKLVLETAKFNVLTAHSTDEALDVFQSFPN